MPVLVVLAAVLALTRAEIIARMKAPVFTMAQGLVRVYADCPEDMRKTYHMPMARFSSDMAELLYRGARIKPVRFQKPGIIIHVGSVRTNLNEVAVRVETNGSRVVTHLYARAPHYVDVRKLRVEFARAFMRCVLGKDAGEAESTALLQAADPRFRIKEEREKLENWLKGKGSLDDEEAFTLMRKVLEPGKASKRDILVFASRLFLYPDTLDRPFAGEVGCVSFRDAVKLARVDPRVRFAAFLKSRELPVFGGGRGRELSESADAYARFLKELTRGKMSDDELYALLDKADALLNEADRLAVSIEETK